MSKLTFKIVLVGILFFYSFCSVQNDDQLICNKKWFLKSICDVQSNEKFVLIGKCRFILMSDSGFYFEDSDTASGEWHSKNDSLFLIPRNGTILKFKIMELTSNDLRLRTELEDLEQEFEFIVTDICE